MSLKKFLPFFIIGVINLSCNKLFIKPDGVSEPEKNFEIFWNDINNGYPYFVEDNINWKDRYKEYKTQVTSSTSITQLYTYFTKMLGGFSDGHLSVKYQGNSYSNEKRGPNSAQLVKNDGSDDLVTTSDVFYYYHFYRINESYLDPDTYVVKKATNGIENGNEDTVCIYGYRQQDKILYINITSFLTKYRFDNLLVEIFSLYPDSKGLILDLRMNGGGNLATMWNAMSVFMPSGVSEVKYAFNKEKVGPLPENFGAETYFAIHGNYFQTTFSQPIVVLANRFTVSAAEHAVLALREINKVRQKKIKIIGDYTYGATSFIVERTLPCGIQYTLVNNKTTDINHNIIERTGVRPDEFSYLTASKIMDGNNPDEQLNRAIEIINTNVF
ncbi:MAG: hypothetical protein H7329_13735 [Opitutaceae bacterium]|nr:hypothetical protein [Cytophagales bacterium]